MIRKIISKIANPQTAGADKERLNSLVNSMADGVLAVDEQMRVVLNNGAALNILDSNNSLQGARLGSIMNLINKNRQHVDIEKLVTKTTTPSSSRDLSLRYSDSSQINLYLSIAPVHLGYGASGPHGYVLLMRDITREKSLEEERDEFVSVVSHELRTPVTIAEGNISNAQFVAQKINADPRIVNALKQAHEQVVFLADLINDLSTLSRAERGKLQVEVSPIDVPELLDAIAEDYKPRAKEKNLELLVDSGQAKILKSSILYVREILQNFMTNALRYTESGSIHLKAESIEGGVKFSVQDSGIGISKSDQEKIFDKFFRSEDYRTRQTNGTGLGLYVVLKLARLLNAEINVDSELNKGSTFSIYIPNLGE